MFIARFINRKRTKDRKPEGKVCVLGSFVVDIIANVESFPKVGELINSKAIR